MTAGCCDVGVLGAAAAWGPGPPLQSRPDASYRLLWGSVL